jgi:hypothetical protein
MNIKIKVTNHFTNQVIIDSVVTLNESTDWATVEANQKAFSEFYPNCYVNFTCEERNSYIFGMPLNQLKDEEAYDKGEMTWWQYCDKWYNGSASGCNEDIDMLDDHEMERQIEELREAQFNQMDSICY